MLRAMVETERQPQIDWTNPSVTALAGGDDPMKRVLHAAREMVFDARERGWSGPPFDPFQLADLRSVAVVPVDEVGEARLVHHQRRARIEFNPNRPMQRVRFSIAHELAHTLFPDAAERVRERAHGPHARSDDWQLELLCNLAAAELLMPTGSFPELAAENLDINQLMRLRSEFEVSPESALLRAVRLTSQPAAVLAVARVNANVPGYRVDYVIGSRAWTPELKRGEILHDQLLAQCTAIGYTAKGEVTASSGRLWAECVGIPPYPGDSYPRVVGLLRPEIPVVSADEPTYVHGDAAQPRGEGSKIIAHVVNDKTATWGGHGFAPHLRAVFPKVQEEFRAWALESGGLELGGAHLTQVGAELWVCTMVAQRGYGLNAPKIPLRYGALDQCLIALCERAREHGASVHMPMIGAGQAGGDWGVISELITARLVGDAASVVIYVLPGAPLPDTREAQLTLRL
jgi:O-acetyl-ADP-ribose deacetylase (regulator of RNase III)